KLQLIAECAAQTWREMNTVACRVDVESLAVGGMTNMELDLRRRQGRRAEADQIEIEARKAAGVADRTRMQASRIEGKDVLLAVAVLPGEALPARGFEDRLVR